MKKVFFLPLLCCCVAALAQKGIPPKETTTANVSSFFPQPVAFSPANLSKLKVAKGYSIRVAAEGLGKPRMMAIDTGGRLYITRRDQGDVLMLTDSNKDGKFDALKTVVSGMPGVHGIVLRNGFIYLCSNKELKRSKLDANGELLPLETLLNDLPDGGQHGNRTIAFGPDDKLYISVGSDCNDCAETNPEHATLLQLDSNGANRKIYARGLRNTIGFDWNKVTHKLWGMDNGTDWRGDTIPPEELNLIIENGNYGWPLVFGKQQADLTREDPPGYTKASYAATTQASVMEFPAHAAPINFIFLNSKTPPPYEGDALVSWHGSWNRMKPEGYKVERIHFVNGLPQSAADFFFGFLSTDGKKRYGRPAGIVQASNGDILVSDDEAGIIYRLEVDKNVAR